jgi:hypothetical protein
MKMPSISAAILLLAFAPASAAYACNLDDPIEIIQGEIGDFGKVRAVALARVSRVVPVPVDEFRKGFEGDNWDAVFDYEKTLRGFIDSRVFVVHQRRAPGYCNIRKPPALGELRVVYIRSDNRVYDVDPKFVQMNDPEVRLKLPYTVSN